MSAEPGKAGPPRLTAGTGAGGLDVRVPGFLGRILDGSGEPVGTCFQVAPGVLATAWHVLVDAGVVGDVGDVVAVDGLPLGGAPSADAEVLAVDPLHDLAVLLRATPLPESVTGLAATDAQVLGTRLRVCGHVVVPDAAGGRRRFLDAAGVWAGGTMRDDAIALGRLRSPDVMRGMSGAPICLDTSIGGAGAPSSVVGIVSARYNSADGWLRDSVWASRIEDLEPLLSGVAAIAVERPAVTAAVDLILTIHASTVQLRTGQTSPDKGLRVDVSAPHAGVSPGLFNALDDVRRARARAGHTRIDLVSGKPIDAPGVRAPETQELWAGTSMRRVGERLAASFLPGPVADELGSVLASAEAASMPVRLGVELSPEAAARGWSQLPWEALAEPVSGQPVALNRLVTVYRHQPGAGAGRHVEGPLRIVVAIAAPTRGGGPILDYEGELRSVLRAVKGARSGAAQVEIVPFATTGAIYQALEGGDVHVLHVTAHGGPGILHLEDQDGNARAVSATEFVAEAIPPGAMPPVIALSACYTDTPTRSTTGAASESAGAAPDEIPESVLGPSFATSLLARGAGVVIGTETSVTDVYATRVLSRVYDRLAHAAAPDVVQAVGQARRLVQQELTDPGASTRERLVSAFDEWASMTVISGAPTRHLASSIIEAPIRGADRARTKVLAGLIARAPGEFVGRRAEQRTLPRELVAGSHAGVVLHGIGGIGKTTLAAEVLRRSLQVDPNLIPVTVTGPTTADALLAAVAARLRPLLLRQGDAAAELQTVAVADRLDVPWVDRLAVLRDVIDALDLVVVLDNFEDNLTRTSQADGWVVANDNLASLLAAWLSAPGPTRFLFTCRYPFALPGGAERSLLSRALGPLTYAETVKLVWSLPRLELLDEADLERVWRNVGGHPRTLEYLDALLAGGQGRFPDIDARLEQRAAGAVAAVGGDVKAWLARDRDLPAALADAVTVAADDVLLVTLLAQFEQMEGALDVLVGASVYREPVDVAAMLYQVGRVDETAGYVPDWAGAEARVLAELGARDVSVEAFNTALASGEADSVEALSSGLLEIVGADLAELHALPRAPRTTDLDLGKIIGELADSTLLTLRMEPSPSADSAGDPELRAFVHRWTAAEITHTWERDGRGEDISLAHVRAAAYWTWRVEVWPQDLHADVHDRLEARYHLLEAGQLDDANALTEQVCSQLDHWGAWDQEAALVHDMLRRLPADHARRPAYYHQLGILAQARGDYEEAERRYRQALEITERLGNQTETASSYHQLGILAQARGDYEEAERRYRQSLEIKERLGNQAGAANTYHQLGILAQHRRDYEEAERRYLQSLEIEERLNNQSGVAISYHQLGMLAQARGDYDAAERRYLQALEIKERLGNQADAASSYHQLGILAHVRRDYDEAERRYLQSLEIEESLGRQSGAASSYFQLGQLAHDWGDHEEAERRYRQSLAIMDGLGDQAGVAGCYHQLGMLAQARDDFEVAERHYLQSIAIRERLGIEAEVANTSSLLGILCMATDREELAVSWHAKALDIRARLQLPQLRFDLRALKGLQDQLGEVAVAARLESVGGAGFARDVLDAMADVGEDSTDGQA